jgi:hypothetical protein
MSSYPAFEDYYDNLRLVLKKFFEVCIVIYSDEIEVSLPRNGNEIYLFLGNVTPRFLKLAIDEHYRHIYLINTEQSTRPIWTMIIQYYSKTGVNIIDYDQYQVGITEKLSPQGKIFYLPYQVTKTETKYLTSVIQKTKKQYNVAFCSTNKSKKRLGVFARLQQKGITVIDVAGWKNCRDKRIAQAQILVNIHYDNDYQIFEHMRCDRWILSGMLVVSEESLSDASTDCKDLMIIEKYDAIVDKIVHIIDNYEFYYSQYLDKLLHQQKKIMKNREKSCLHLVEILQSVKTK